MHRFPVRDLRERTGELSVISKHGAPLFVALPFDEKRLREGVGTSLAHKSRQRHGSASLATSARTVVAEAGPLSALGGLDLVHPLPALRTAGEAAD